MNVLVTGSAGFIGANLVLNLLEQDSPIDIVGLDSLNAYYDIRLKEYRLGLIDRCAAEHPESKYTFVKGNEHFVICLPEYFGTEYSVIAQRIDGIDYLIASPTIEAAVNMIELFRKPEMPR